MASETPFEQSDQPIPEGDDEATLLAGAFNSLAAQLLAGTLRPDRAKVLAQLAITPKILQVEGPRSDTHPYRRRIISNILSTGDYEDPHVFSSGPFNLNYIHTDPDEYRRSKGPKSFISWLELHKALFDSQRTELTNPVSPFSLLMSGITTSLLQPFFLADSPSPMQIALAHVMASRDWLLDEQTDPGGPGEMPLSIEGSEIKSSSWGALLSIPDIQRKQLKIYFRQRLLDHIAENLYFNGIDFRGMTKTQQFRDAIEYIKSVSKDVETTALKGTKGSGITGVEGVMAQIADLVHQHTIGSNPREKHAIANLILDAKSHPLSNIDRNWQEICDNPIVMIVAGSSGGKTTLIDYWAQILSAIDGQRYDVEERPNKISTGLLYKKEIALGGIFVSLTANPARRINIAKPAHLLRDLTGMEKEKTEQAKPRITLLEMSAITKIGSKDCPEALKRALINGHIRDLNDDLASDDGLIRHQFSPNRAQLPSLMLAASADNSIDLVGRGYPVPASPTNHKYFNEVLSELRLEKVKSGSHMQATLLKNYSAVMHALPAEMAEYIAFSGLIGLRTNFISTPYAKSERHLPDRITKLGDIYNILTMSDFGLLNIKPEDQEDFENQFSRNYSGQFDIGALCQKYKSQLHPKLRQVIEFADEIKGINEFTYTMAENLYNLAICINTIVN